MESLVDKAIGYLRVVSAPNLFTGFKLTRSQGAAITDNLEVQAGESREGKLHRHVNEFQYVV